MTAPSDLKPEDVFDFADLPSMPGEQHESFVNALHVLVQLAANHLKLDLFRYGNRITPAHGDALTAILHKYTFLATRIQTGRWVFDLDTGMGKTTSVIAWVTAVLELRFPFSIAVATNHVEALCRIKEALIANGVDPEKIGLMHSKRYAPDKAEAACRGDDPKVAKKYASLPATDRNYERQVLLATHERLRSKAKLHEFNIYHDRDRDLVIWDESLLATESTQVPLHEIESALGWLAPMVFRARNRDPERAKQEAAVEYLEECTRLLQDEVQALSSDGYVARTLDLPVQTDAQIDGYTRLIRTAFRRYRGPANQASALPDLLAMVGEPVRVVMTGGDPVVVQTSVKVPDELERVVILDASFPIRELEKRDPRIQHDPSFNGRVKRYSQVTIHHWKRGAGRGSIEREFRQERDEDRLLSREIVEVLQYVPPDEAVLIFTFKTERLDLGAVLRRDLRAAGIDTIAKLPDGRDRFSWLTWGRETSLNEFGHCAHVIFAGVLYRSFEDLAAATLAQGRDLLAKVDGGDVEEVRRSEVAHGLYQAMSRGACRFVDGVEARKMDVWLPLYDEKILELLATAMPGIQTTDWDLVHVEAGRASFEEVAEVIVGYLGNLPSEVREVPIKQLKADCGLEKVGRRTFQRARDEALEQLRIWTVVRQSLRRVDF